MTHIPATDIVECYLSTKQEHHTVEGNQRDPAWRYTDPSGTVHQWVGNRPGSLTLHEEERTDEDGDAYTLATWHDPVTGDVVTPGYRTGTFLVLHAVEATLKLTLLPHCESETIIPALMVGAQTVTIELPHPMNCCVRGYLLQVDGPWTIGLVATFRLVVV